MGLAAGIRHQASDLVENKGMFFYKLGNCILAGKVFDLNTDQIPVQVAFSSVK